MDDEWLGWIIYLFIIFSVYIYVGYVKLITILIVVFAILFFMSVLSALSHGFGIVSIVLFLFGLLFISMMVSIWSQIYNVRIIFSESGWIIFEVCSPVLAHFMIFSSLLICSQLKLQYCRNLFGTVWTFFGINLLFSMLACITWLCTIVFFRVLTL